jgi:hypothetical protein
LTAIGCTDAVPIASGGSSVVYRARQEEFDRLIAVKVLALPVVDERTRRRFQRELAMAGRLTGHPNVVTVFASGFLPDGRGYVQMEYCPGGSLADRLTAEGVLPVQDVVSIGVKICGVLELAAREGIVHCVAGHRGREHGPGGGALLRRLSPDAAGLGLFKTSPNRTVHGTSRCRPVRG